MHKTMKIVLAVVIGAVLVDVHVTSSLRAPLQRSRIPA